MSPASPQQWLHSIHLDYHRVGTQEMMGGCVDRWVDEWIGAKVVSCVFGWMGDWLVKQMGG